MPEIKNFKKAARRIQKAIKGKEKIILYGDADLDGVASAIILKETIKNLGGEAEAVYFPNREKEGYGLNNVVLKFLKPIAPALLITLDLGIGNFAEVVEAGKMGFEVIIIDHHQALSRLPKASIIIDPKQPGDKFPFKEMANTGIIYKFSQLLLKDKISDNLNKDFLSLTALATIADMMVETDENKVFIDQGLNVLSESFRPGLRVLWEKSRIDSVSTRQIAQNMIAVLNAGETINHLNESYLFLISTDLTVAEKLVEKLQVKHWQKKERIKDINLEIENLIKKSDEPIVFIGDADWNLILLGSVASRICDKHGKPTFIFKKGEKDSPGTVRMPKGLNGVEAMNSCQRLLKTYGGHPLAAGFRVENKNLEKFKECLIKYFKEKGL